MMTTQATVSPVLWAQIVSDMRMPLIRSATSEEVISDLKVGTLQPASVFAPNIRSEKCFSLEVHDFA